MDGAQRGARRSCRCCAAVHGEPEVSRQAFVEALRKILLAEATPAATRQEFLGGFVTCLVEAKERAAVIQAFVELDVLGAAAAGAVPKLVELGLTSQRRYGAEAAVKTLGKFYCAEATLEATPQGILKALGLQGPRA